MTLVALALNAWRLDVNGLGNQYYAAAARSMSGSGHDFFFGALDPGGFISVDKPPVAVWASALSAHLFGYGAWSLLLPSALAGAAAVALLWCTVRRTAGPIAATVAGAVLALSPINVAVDRLNLPEPFLVLTLVAAAWAVVRSFESTRPLRWVVLAGVFVGIGFNTKMLAADIAVPALALAIAIGTAGRWWPRVRNLAAFGIAAAVASVPWMVALALTPAGHRPWMGGSTNDSVADLVLGYNGIGRIDGNGVHGSPQATPAKGIGGIIAGVPGPFRFFGPALAGQVTWLLPLALVGAAVATWRYRRNLPRLAAVALWAGWLAAYAVVFSEAAGIFHAYYTSVLVPALAALVGLGAEAAVAELRARPRAAVPIAAGAVAVTIAWQFQVSGRVPGYFGWTRPLALALAAGAVVVAMLTWTARRPRAALAVTTVALAATLVTPAAWAASQAVHRPTNTTLPQAGPRRGAASTSFGSVSSDGDAPLATFLRAHDRGTRWALVTANARQASGLIAYDDVSVMALGGFMGTDPATQLDQVAHLVGTGQVRYFAPAPLSRKEMAQLVARNLLRLTGERVPIGPSVAAAPRLAVGPPTTQVAPPTTRTEPPVHGSRTVAGQIMEAVVDVCRPVSLPPTVVRQRSTGLGPIWDCRGRGQALRQAGLDRGRA